MPAWKIDTLDARGGLAFASWYDEPSLDSDGDSRNYCIFVGAPSFEPEPITNRAIALAASRGAFQTGLFADGNEVLFPTPSAVAEFVRRVYLRSGGGDGAEGGGGERPPPRPLGSPELPRSPEVAGEEFEGPSLRPKIMEAVKNFQKIASQLKADSVEQFKWVFDIDLERERKSISRGSDGPAMLASASVQLIYEMAQRFPFKGEPLALARWQRDARRLGALLCHLDLWPLLLSAPYRQSLELLTKHLAESIHGFDSIIAKYPEDFRTNIVLMLLFLDGPLADDYDGIRWYLRSCFDSCFPGPFWPISGATKDIGEPIEAIARIPLPEGFGKFIDPNLKDNASLYHALTAFVGAPATILTLDRPAALIDLVLFASACIVGPDGGRTLSSTDGWQQWHPSLADSLSRRAAIQATADNAWKWLAEHLPTLVFYQNLETAIQSAASLRYETAR